MLFFYLGKGGEITSKYSLFSHGKSVVASLLSHKNCGGKEHLQNIDNDKKGKNKKTTVE